MGNHQRAAPHFCREGLCHIFFGTIPVEVRISAEVAAPPTGSGDFPEKTLHRGAVPSDQGASRRGISGRRRGSRRSQSVLIRRHAFLCGGEDRRPTIAFSV